MCSGAYVVTYAPLHIELDRFLKINMKLCSQDISEFSVIPNAAQGESYSFMPCRMVYLRHFETLEMWELWNLFKG